MHEARRTVQEQLAQLLPKSARPAIADADLRAGPAFGLMRSLALFAQRGDAPLQAGSVHQQLAELAPVVPGIEEADPDVALGVVVLAALARDDLRRGRATSASRLAALAGCSRRQITGLVRAGELSAELHTEGGGQGLYLIQARSAKRWLATQQIPGFSG